MTQVKFPQKVKAKNLWTNVSPGHQNSTHTLLKLQQSAVHNHTAAMLEMGTSLLSQTAEQTRKLTDVETQVLNQTSRLEIQLLENSLSTNKLEKQLMIQINEINKIHDKNGFLEVKMQEMEDRHREELETLREEKSSLQALVSRQSSVIRELEAQLSRATGNSTALQRQQQDLMDNVRKLLSLCPKDGVIACQDLVPVFVRSGFGPSPNAVIWDWRFPSNPHGSLHTSRSQCSELVTLVSSRCNPSVASWPHVYPTSAPRLCGHRKFTLNVWDGTAQVMESPQLLSFRLAVREPKATLLPAILNSPLLHRPAPACCRGRFPDPWLNLSNLMTPVGRLVQIGGKEGTIVRNFKINIRETLSILKRRSAKFPSVNLSQREILVADTQSFTEVAGIISLNEGLPAQALGPATGIKAVCLVEMEVTVSTCSVWPNMRLGHAERESELKLFYLFNASGADPQTFSDICVPVQTAPFIISLVVYVFAVSNMVFVVCLVVPNSTKQADEERKFQDCADLYQAGFQKNGVYTINISPQETKKVYCNMESAGGGWTVVQRREDGSVDFQRTWKEYKMGFGSVTAEHWLGNEFVHILTNQRQFALRVELTDWDGHQAFSQYDSFHIDSEKHNYRAVFRGVLHTWLARSDLCW
ncbi:Angiopoietin-1 [Labeo rohita]|uniref:Angiopoietin-1 n=1 Tax=Labeo rohita TaxID=84645 RepID=A0ABQ8LQI8_LABRO|nr:Angiopoietin-1 [Labeo rohita]